MNKLIKSIRVKSVLTVLALASAIVLSMRVKETQAQSSFTPLTGKCGMLYNNSFFGFDTIKTGQTGVVSNMLMMWDFDAGTASFIQAKIDNYGQNSVTLAPLTGTFNFTQASGDISGSVKLIFGGGGNAYITVLPVNSGNTFLVQLAGGGNGSAPGSGVCQRI